MEESARQLNDEESGNQASKPGSKPDWYHNVHPKGGGESSKPNRDWYDNHNQPKDSTGAKDLNGREENPDGNLPGRHLNAVPDQPKSLYTRSQPSGKGFLGRFTRRQKWLGAGLGGGIIGGGIIVFFLFFLPALRLESYLAGINQRVFTAANYAVSKRVENLFERYTITRVLTIQRCGAVVSASCQADYTKMGFASDLFKSWQDARIENKLFEQNGFEVRSYKNPQGKQLYKIISNGTVIGNKGDELTIKDGKLALGKFEGGSRIFGSEWNKFINDQTRWDQVVQRISLRKYLVRKHGTKFWCFFKCEAKDSVDLKVKDAKTRLKYKLIQRVIYPFSPKLGFIMDCLVSGADTGPGGKCGPEALRSRGIESNTLSDEEVTKLTEQFDKNPNLKLSQVLIQRLAEKILGKEIDQKSLSAIPVAGQIYLALSMIDMFNQADQCLANYCLSHFAADLNSSQYVEYYTAMRSANDEMKAGVLSGDEVGALTSQFDEGNQPPEQSLVYQTYYNPSKVADLLSGKAYAAPSQTEYKCANGQPIPTGQLVCPEKKVARTFKIEDIRNDDFVAGLDNALNVYQACPTPEIFGRCTSLRPVTIIHPVLKSIDNISSIILGPIVKETIASFKLLPGVKILVNYVTGKLGDLIQGFLGKLFPLPIQVDSPGRDRYDALEAGGEVSASEFAKGGYTDDGQPYGLGGKLLTNDEQRSIALNYSQQQNYDFQKSGFIARLTNLDNPNSAANHFIAAMPTSLSQLPQKFASMLVHPFASFNLFWHPALAATDTSTLNAFGIPRFGYPVNDPALTADPSIYSDQYCQQQKDSWEASKTDNPVSGIDEYSMTDPCLLEQTAVEAAGDAFTQNDDINNDSSSGSGSSTIPPGNGSAQELARQILSNKNIQLSGRLVAQDIHAAANNRPGSAGVYTSAIILRLIVAVGASHSVQISAIQSGGTGHTTGSLHYFGDAVDFSALDGRLLTGRDSGSISIMRISFSILPAGSGFGQSQCGITPPLPSGITTFPDTCNHLHVQVPRGAP